MYVPKPFELRDLPRLHAHMRLHDFAVLAAAADGGGAPEAVHLPLLLDAGRGALGALEGHVARANPIWRAFDPAREVLAVFAGPHAYVSPTWYLDPAANVPTWNYAAVHAYGRPRLVEDPAAVTAMQARLVEAYEAGRTPRWTMEGAKPGLVDGLVRGIVAFEIEITRIEGALKLSQNKRPGDRRGVVAGLRAAGEDALAGLMATETALDD